ncbi:MAG: type VI secretion system baseplate subunit TssE [Candidatus Electrothrix aestuarii]|uniref:Type VI secretion system baseplate subunit TssE n=1 Tax=Candidatus Electrothrix aestuarii TaxID=3062594 RepID=A0AAU8LVY9_9BACT|nr:type VI secretion system baseplate subunit TssE [Candidatus Electrothrix aestuarii]
MQERLLERISRLEMEEKGEREEPATTSDATRSVLRHLSRLLNTRQGSVATLPDYGVPDLTNVPGDSVQEIRENIEQILQKIVQKYEPRLSRIRMIMNQNDKDPFALRFRIEAVLTEQENVPVTFETVISTDGHIGIS